MLSTAQEVSLNHQSGGVFIKSKDTRETYNILKSNKIECSIIGKLIKVNCYSIGIYE